MMQYAFTYHKISTDWLNKGAPVTDILQNAKAANMPTAQLEGRRMAVSVTGGRLGICRDGGQLPTHLGHVLALCFSNTAHVCFLTICVFVSEATATKKNWASVYFKSRL